MIIKSLINFYKNLVSVILPRKKKEAVSKKKIKLKSNILVKYLYNFFFNNSYKTVKPQVQTIRSSVETSILTYDHYKHFNRNMFLRIKKDGYFKNSNKKYFNLFLKAYKKKLKTLEELSKLRKEAIGKKRDLPAVLKGTSSDFFTGFNRSRSIDVSVKKKKFFKMESKKMSIDDAKDFSKNWERKNRKKNRWTASDFGDSPYLLAQEKGLEKMKELEAFRQSRGWISRRKRFYFYRKSMKEWRSLNFLRLNYFNKPFLIKSNWDNRKSWNQVYFFNYASRYLYFKNKSTIRVYFLRYLAKRKNSQLKSFLKSLSYKKQKLLFFFNKFESRLDNFILNWGYLSKLTISKTRFLIEKGFVYVNFNPNFFYNYTIKKNDCVTLTYHGLNKHKLYYHELNIGSTKWHKSLVEHRHISRRRRRKFVQHNNSRIVYELIRFLKFSHWNKRYFNFFFRFFESSPIIKTFVYLHFYSWFSYKFSKFINYLMFSKRINSIFLNTRLF